MKILYGLPSEGMGHATRSKVIIDYLLLNGHDVQIVTSDRAYVFMQKHFGVRVHPIEGFHLAYKKAVVHIGQTVLLTFKNAPKQLLKNFLAYKELLKKFTPDIVISDFESFTHFFATMHHIPLISIDNMQVIHRCKLDIDIPKEEKLNFQIAKQIVKSKVIGADTYLISSFFHAEIIKKNTVLVPPILRKEIIEAKVTIGKHIVVYQTSSTASNLITTLQQLPQEIFIVYGFNKEEKHGNVQLKAFSEKEFIANLASAKAVLSNGGFSFLSEAVYLKKPILSVAIQNQFEQFVNASYVEKMNFGRSFSTFTSDGIKAFLYELDFFQDALQSHAQDGNQVLFTTLDSLLKSLTSEV